MTEQPFGSLSGVPSMEEIIIIYDNDEVYSWKLEDVEDILGLTHYMATQLTAFHGIYGGEVSKVTPTVQPSAPELVEKVIDPFLDAHMGWYPIELAEAILEFMRTHTKESADEG